jgi:hypothetical protein
MDLAYHCILKWTEEEKRVVIADNMGVSIADRVLIPMRSGKIELYQVESFFPMEYYPPPNTPFNEPVKIKGQLAWNVKIKKIIKN